MKQIKKWVYYCDFCKKKGLSSYHMKNHEASCTMNPARTCGLCGYIDSCKVDIKNLSNIVFNSVCETNDDMLDTYKFREGHSEESVLQNLRAETECPACILAILRQSCVPFMFKSFDFQVEKKAIFDDHNRSVTRY